ncbi:ABC transporter ATP-binding protein [Nocardia speluncae]|uniref:ABC transporter ATP-binding protein n=1 Tax=Nocardia speluncae TaxID=419477 RepID=A0A846XF76_9NOCA|nr:ABC transporter ATP-binding protein [Nocardia speluncae]NKY33273.1 ABC transporter ATP-binding protein [Nocardia speluncae]
MLEISGLGKEYGSGSARHTALREVTFDVRANELISVVGPSGCGKTTLLKCISGLLKPTTGTVTMHGRPVNGPPPGMAVVFQDYSRSLYPWMTVSENVAFPLHGQSRSTGEIATLVADSLQAVGLANAADKHPYELSGGMQQRAAIARAVAFQPEIMLMDEPFASVDAQTREDLEDLVLAIRAEFGMTVVVVTHDIDEAVYLGDRVVVLSSAPTVVRADLSVDLPTPRNQLDTKSLNAFATTRGRVYRLVKSTEPVDTVETA